MKKTKNEFTCDRCGETFPKAWTDEEAMEEAKQNGWENESLSEVCDDCYKKFMGWYKGQN